MKLLVVDDHPLVREGLTAFLRQGQPSTVVLQAQDSIQGLDLAERHPDLDVVLIDLTLPGMGGHSAILEFGKRHPSLPVIVLSSSEDPRDVRAAFAAGARGYVAKSAPRQTLLAALQLVLDGNRYVPEFMLLDSAPEGVADGPRKSGQRLTERQLEVLQRMANGLSNKEIGLKLGVSEKTVKVHVTDIFQALNVANRMQAVAAARELSLI
jgi:two-component system nitrate/nitrite response regulator NarL